MLDLRSAVPLYWQLEDVLRSRIDNGELSPGEQIPPLPALCSEFEMSQGTVRQALANLEQEGLIVRKQGKGSFVAEPRRPQELSVASSFSTHYRTALGSKLGSQLLSVDTVPAKGSVAEKLALSEQTDVVAIRKLKTDEGEPFFLVTSYIEKSAFPGIELEDHSTGSLFDLITGKYQLQITQVQGWLEPVLTNDFQSKLLSVKRRSSAMLYDRVRFSGSRPMVLSRHLIRGDMCRLHFQLNGSS